METDRHTTLVCMAHCYMEYQSDKPHWSHTAGCMVTRTVCVRTVDYSDIVDACLEDLPERKYL